MIIVKMFTSLMLITMAICRYEADDNDYDDNSS